LALDSMVACDPCLEIFGFPQFSNSVSV